MSRETYLAPQICPSIPESLFYKNKLTLKRCSYCDNETVDGVEFPGFPASLEPQTGEHERLVIADMSSNFLSRHVDIRKYAAIFGGAQKNIGMCSLRQCSLICIDP